MGRILVGSADGLHDLATGDSWLGGQEVTAMSAAHGRCWLLLDGREVITLSAALAPDASLGSLPTDLAGRCLTARRGTAFIGTSEAHLFTASDSAPVAILSSFEEAPERESWYTPWGDPADVRSVAISGAGDLVVNVHVGGLVRRERPRTGADAGPWVQTIDIDADVHQVVTGPGSVMVAAAAVGLCVSVDDGATWEIENDTMHATYARAVCIAHDHIILSASTGPDGGQSCLYRRQAGGRQALEKCGGGLPEWWDSNIDTALLVASGRHVALATEQGDVWSSNDAGASWRAVATSLPPPRAIAII